MFITDVLAVVNWCFKTWQSKSKKTKQQKDKKTTKNNNTLDNNTCTLIIFIHLQLVHWELQRVVLIWANGVRGFFVCGHVGPAGLETTCCVPVGRSWCSSLSSATVVQCRLFMAVCVFWTTRSCHGLCWFVFPASPVQEAQWKLNGLHSSSLGITFFVSIVKGSELYSIYKYIHIFYLYAYI